MTNALQIPDPSAQPSTARRILRIVKAVVSIAMLVLGVAWVVSGVLQASSWDSPTGYRGSAQGSVTAVAGFDPDGSADQGCSVSYAFVVEGRSYRGVSSVGSNADCASVEGDAIEIVYDPDSPQRNAIASEKEPGYRDGGIVAAVLGIILTGLGVGGCLSVLRARKRSRLGIRAPGLQHQPLPPTPSEQGGTTAGPDSSRWLVQPRGPRPDPIRPPDLSDLRRDRGQTLPQRMASVASAQSRYRANPHAGRAAPFVLQSIGLVVTAAVFFAAGLFAYNISRPSADQTAQAEATVTEVYYSEDSEGTTMCALNYQFEVADLTYSSRTAASSTIYCNRAQGSSLEIQYNPANPDDNSVRGEGTTSQIIGIVFMAVGALLILSRIYGFAMRAIRGRGAA
ncbi:MAG: DUF3592 domain-containing protein [Bifidobacteriaceae bacterium]|jgi:hypothetical protein|nr:DUF3592 domain-containing protein [Bifidobacteriaceae bacterium]